MIFTAQDRFKKLAEINPDIQKLKQAFDLDVDY